MNVCVSVTGRGRSGAVDNLWKVENRIKYFHSQHVVIIENVKIVSFHVDRVSDCGKIGFGLVMSRQVGLIPDGAARDRSGKTKTSKREAVS